LPSKRPKPPRIFVSYSRADISLVGKLVKLMRVGSPLLFRDEDDLIPGDKWKPTLRKNICDCNTFLLFWCWHSKASTAVRAEWKQAVKERKRIVPVLLDATPLPSPLGDFQWIDLRRLMHRHQKRLRFKAYGRIGARPSAKQQYIEPTYEAGLQLRVELFRLLA
jgi:hypothetical protein